MPPYPFSCVLNPVEKSQQISGVLVVLSACRERGFVAGFFRQLRNVLVQPPCKRAEPKNRAMQQRRKLCKTVESSGVRVLVTDYRPQLGAVPLAPGERQQDSGCEHTNGYRHNHEW